MMGSNVMFLTDPPDLTELLLVSLHCMRARGRRQKGTCANNILLLRA